MKYILIAAFLISSCISSPEEQRTGEIGTRILDYPDGELLLYHKGVNVWSCRGVRIDELSRTYTCQYLDK